MVFWVGQWRKGEFPFCSPQDYKLFFYCYRVEKWKALYLLLKTGGDNNTGSNSSLCPGAFPFELISGIFKKSFLWTGSVYEKEGLSYEFSVKLHMTHCKLNLLPKIYFTLWYRVCAKMTVFSFDETASGHFSVFIYIINRH